MNEYENNGSEELLNVPVRLISWHQGPQQVGETSQEEEIAENEADFCLVLEATAGLNWRSSSRLISLLNLKNSQRIIRIVRWT
jgi:hypothetical protein